MLTQRAVHPLTRPWPAARAGVLALIMSACGSSAAVQNPVGAGPGLCQITAQVEGLVVQRLAPYGDLSSSFGFPASVAVTNPTAAREIAADVCALPVVPPGVYHCPKGFGIIYNLRFST